MRVLSAGGSFALRAHNEMTGDSKIRVRAMSSPNPSLFEDVRGSAIEKVVLVALFLLAAAAGVRYLGAATEKTLTCQGQSIQRADGTVTCVGSTVGPAGPGPVAGVTNSVDPPAGNARPCVGLQ